MALPSLAASSHALHPCQELRTGAVGHNPFHFSRASERWKGGRLLSSVRSAVLRSKGVGGVSPEFFTWQRLYNSSAILQERTIAVYPGTAFSDNEEKV